MSAHDLAARALRTLDPETAHRLTVRALAAGLGPVSAPDDPILATELPGLRLPNPIGLAAGFDKNAEAHGPMLRAGFGFVECGTVTPRPQPGNPKPRLFRLTEDSAVINRLGFNNEGLEPFAARLAHRRRAGVVGANLGANKDSADRAADYVTGLRRLWALPDYFTVNISSPNTPGLRDLQSRAALDDLLGRLGRARAELAAAQPDTAPLFLKIAPDLHEADVSDVVESAVAHRLDGLIVSNTTIARPDALRSPRRSEAGGLSGAPLFEPSTALLRRVAEIAAGRLVLIGAGGVGSGEQAYAKIRAGASAVQLYSALVYGGPGLVTRIKRDLAARLRADGFAAVAQAVGAA
ncbi:MAG TPA: quinone-dependent dihydroorotate dehydrogenase [Caulobacteraceae bacterium]